MKSIKKFSFVFLTILLVLLTVACNNETTNKFNVNLKYEDGTAYKSVTVNEGESVTLDSLTKDGYTFLGWYLNDEKQNSPFVPTANIELVAKFEINKYTYKFLDFDGTVLKEETVNYGSKIVAPNDPTREETAEYRYEFIGWDQEFDTITADIEIKAQYKEIKKEVQEEHKHVEEILPAVDATCTETGLTEGKKCSECGEILVAQTTIPALGHNYVDGKCACGADDPNYQPEKPHEHTEVVIPGRDATCTETGLTEGKKCSECGEILVAQTEIAKVNHTEEVIPGREATCIKTGLTEGKKCSVCGEILVAQTEVAKGDHKEEVIPGFEATCTEVGLTEGKKCSVCGEVTLAQTVIFQLDHQYENGKCSECGAVDPNSQPVTPHTHTEVVIPGYDATCTKTGLTEGKKCSSCGEILVVQKEISKVAHKYENGKCTVCSADDPNYTPDVKIDSLEGLKVSILGDSISTFYSASSSINSYYGQDGRYYYPIYSSTVKTVEKTWWYQLINNNKMAWGINNSWSGSAAYGSGESAGQSDARINTIDDNGMPDIVIIFLGTNDCASGFSVDNFSNAIKNMITKIRKLGDPQIFLTTLGYSDYNSNNYKENRVLYNAELRKIASNYNCGIVPLDEYIVETSYMFYLGDRLHHNAKGAELLSKIYEKTIKEYNGITYTGKIEVEHEEQLPEGVLGKITATANSGFWTGYASNVYFTTASAAANAIYSTTYEITKNASDNKYYVTKINKSGDSQGFNCDYVLMISDAHTEQTKLVQSLKNVKVGSIVEFNPNGSFPMEIVFKEGNGTLPSNPTPDTPVTPPAEKVEGELNVGAFNDGVWTKYADTVIAYEQAKLGQGSKYINFYIIGLTKESGSNYKITCLKPLNDSSFAFPQCDYYILIYMDLEEKSYYENAKIGDMVTINGDITSGTCSIAFK